MAELVNLRTARKQAKRRHNDERAHASRLAHGQPKHLRELEDAFWKGLKEIANGQDLTLSDLVASIDTDRRHGNLSSAIRLYVLDHYRAQIGDQRGSQPVVHDGSSARASSSVLRAD